MKIWWDKIKKGKKSNSGKSKIPVIWAFLSPIKFRITWGQLHFLEITTLNQQKMLPRSFNFTNDIIVLSSFYTAFDFTSNFMACHSQKQSPGCVLRKSFEKTLAKTSHNSTYFRRRQHIEYLWTNFSNWLKNIFSLFIATHPFPLRLSKFPLRRHCRHQ